MDSIRVSEAFDPRSIRGVATETINPAFAGGVYCFKIKSANGISHYRLAENE